MDKQMSQKAVGCTPPPIDDTVSGPVRLSRWYSSLQTTSAVWVAADNNWWFINSYFKYKVTGIQICLKLDGAFFFFMFAIKIGRC